MNRKTLLVAALAALAAGEAAAQSLRDLRSRGKEEAALAREAAYTSEVCERTIPARIDWASTARWSDRESIADACDGALGAVETICRAGRRNVVHEFICAGDGSGPSLSGKTLRYGATRGVNGYAATLATIGAAE